MYISLLVHVAGVWTAIAPCQSRLNIIGVMWVVN